MLQNPELLKWQYCSFKKFRVGNQIKYSSFHTKILKLPYLLHLLFLIILQERGVLCASTEILLGDILLAEGSASSFLKS